MMEARPTLQGTNRVRSLLDLLNKFIGAVIIYGPKNKTKKAIKARKARKQARRKNNRGKETRESQHKGEAANDPPNRAPPSS
jgi:hypothetical protein